MFNLKQLHSIHILILFHAIGLVIFYHSNQPIGLSSFNILLCSALILNTVQDKKTEFQLLGWIALGGWLIEVIGVNTGLLFGNYQYGHELGFKIYNVPIVLGLNWYCVVVSTSQVVEKHFNTNLYAKAMIAGLLSTALDFVIEPVAIKYDFWTWEGGIIPFFNYACWFIFSSFFAGFYLLKSRDLDWNKTAYSLFFVWLIFFTVLNFI